MGWVFTVAGDGARGREGIIIWVRVFQFPIDAKSSGSACVFPCQSHMYGDREGKSGSLNAVNGQLSKLESPTGHRKSYCQTKNQRGEKSTLERAITKPHAKGAWIQK